MVFYDKSSIILLVIIKFYSKCGSRSDVGDQAKVQHCGVSVLGLFPRWEGNLTGGFYGLGPKP